MFLQRDMDVARSYMAIFRKKIHYWYITVQGIDLNSLLRRYGKPMAKPLWIESKLYNRRRLCNDKVAVSKWKSSLLWTDGIRNGVSQLDILAQYGGFLLKINKTGYEESGIIAESEFEVTERWPTAQTVWMFSCVKMV